MTITGISTLILSVGTVFASGFNEKLRHLENRIDRGVVKGDLTNREAGILEKEIDQIRDYRRILARDGHFSIRDKARLDKQLDKTERHLADLKNNRIRREPLKKRIEGRLEKQYDRIDQGKKSGELTRREAVALENEHHDIQRDTRRSLRDGRLSRNEFARIDHRLNRASEHISRLVNNNETRYAQRNRRNQDIVRGYPHHNQGFGITINLSNGHVKPLPKRPPLPRAKVVHKKKPPIVGHHLY